ncbi:MAG: efflux RND transporter periplasmic adaptor subunit [Gammaproteobacteria bacterium]|nr:efflux RND transporter periplasmic adaptor subunit [Gammaproteobacteria bacterium]
MDKKALLDELKIDRTAAPPRGRPLKWFVLIAVVGGVGFVAWFFQFPPQGELIPINTAVARAASQVATGSSVLDATGYVVARRMATVSSKTTGKVLEVYIEEGLLVEEGQLLAQLDDSIPRAQLELSESRLAAARSGLNEIKIQIRQAQLDLNRTQELAHRKLASQADLDRDGLSVEGLIARLDRARQDIFVAERSVAVQITMLADMRILAPFRGVVVAKAAQPGEMISPISAGGGFTRTGICTIVDMDSLEVEVDVNESYINRVYARQRVQVTLNAYPDHHFPAEVIAIIPTADRNKATVRVRVALLEKDDRILPDMGVRVAFLEEQQEVDTQSAIPVGVLVPNAAVVQDAGLGEAFVYVVSNEQVHRRTVTVGSREGILLRLVSGLSSGERVIADLSDESLLGLADGDRVSVIN